MPCFVSMAGTEREPDNTAPDVSLILARDLSVGSFTLKRTIRQGEMACLKPRRAALDKKQQKIIEPKVRVY